MTISANCPKCSFTLKVRDEYGGKRVMCPKCREPVSIPGGTAAVGSRDAAKGGAKPAPVARQAQKAGTAAKPAVRASAASTGGRTRYNPLLDLLDEAGVEAAPRGDVCPACNKDMKPGQILCVECGYHVELGKQVETAILIDDSDARLEDSRSDAEKRMAQAEKDIDEMPIGEFGQDFGEGKESFLIATVAVVFLVLFITAGVTIVFTMDIITEYISSQAISLLASGLMALMSIVWITSVAFRINPAHGTACLFTAGLYCIPFGFMQGKTLLLPSVILCLSLVIGLGSGYFVLYPPDRDDAALQLLQYAFLHRRWVGLS